jgi:NADH-quinone oxidoreductase subunit N
MYIFSEQINFISFIPEILLSLYIVVNLLFITELKKFYQFHDKTSSIRSYLSTQSFIILVITFILFYNVSLSIDENTYASRALFINSLSTLNLKLIIVFLSILVLGAISIALDIEKINSLEFHILYLFSLLSGLLLISANDFLIVYLLIEMQSLCFYIMTNLNKKNVLCAEAGLKYFLLGSIASCLLIFGLSLLYGVLGTLNFHDLAVICSSKFPYESFGSVFLISVIGLFLVLIALFFKLGVFPFSFWLPGVYTNIPVSSTIVISYLPKIIYLYLLIKIFLVCTSFFQSLSLIFTLVGFFSIIVGSYFALTATNFKDFINCSSVSQIGFPICLFGNGLQAELSFIYFFIIFYTLNTVGLWIMYTIILSFKYGNLNDVYINRQETTLELTDITFFCKTNMAFGYLFSVFFLSNAGLPPFGGFLIKSIILYDLVLQQNIVLSIYFVILSAFSFFYYFRIIVNIFFNKDIRNYYSSSLQLDSYLSFINLFCFLVILFLITFTLFYVDFIFFYCNKLLVTEIY